MRRWLGSLDLTVLEQLFEVLIDVVFVAKDRDLRILAANSAMARLCGVQRPLQLIGHRSEDFLRAANGDTCSNLDQQVLDTGKAVSNRIALGANADGEPLWLLDTRVPVRDERGDIVGLATCGRLNRALARTDPIYRRVEPIKRHIESTFAEPLNIGELAEMAGISERQLDRDFINLLGVTPVALHNKARIEHAIELLVTDQTISEIAHECGYSDHSAFSRRFREAVGISPRDYRAILKKDAVQN